MLIETAVMQVLAVDDAGMVDEGRPVERPSREQVGPLLNKLVLRELHEGALQWQRRQQGMI